MLYSKDLLVEEENFEKMEEAKKALLAKKKANEKVYYFLKKRKPILLQMLKGLKLARLRRFIDKGLRRRGGRFEFPCSMYDLDLDCGFEDHNSDFSVLEEGGSSCSPILGKRSPEDRVENFEGSSGRKQLPNPNKKLKISSEETECEIVDKQSFSRENINSEPTPPRVAQLKSVEEEEELGKRKESAKKIAPGFWQKKRSRHRLASLSLDEIEREVKFLLDDGDKVSTTRSTTSKSSISGQLPFHPENFLREKQVKKRPNLGPRTGRGWSPSNISSDFSEEPPFYENVALNLSYSELDLLRNLRDAKLREVEEINQSIVLVKKKILTLKKGFLA